MSVSCSYSCLQKIEVENAELCFYKGTELENPTTNSMLDV